MPSEAIEVEGMHATAEGLVIHAPLPTVDAGALLAKAVEHGASIDMLERLMALRERLNAEQARAAYFAALSAFQGECPIIAKKREAGSGGWRYFYAPLDDIVEQVAPILQRHGLSYTFQTRDLFEPTPAKVVTCTVHHVAGHSESTEMTAPIDKTARMNDTQKVASVVTYLKRYTFCNGFGILTGDSDDDADLGGSKDGDTPTDRTGFGAPRRASDTKPKSYVCDHFVTGRAVPCELCAKRDEREPGSDDGEPEKPADAISGAKAARVYALIHEALRAARQPDDDATMELVTAELDRLVQKNCQRPKWQWVSWKGDAYDKLCKAIPAVVEKLAARPKPAARFVRR